MCEFEHFYNLEFRSLPSLIFLKAHTLVWFLGKPDLSPRLLTSLISRKAQSSTTPEIKIFPILASAFFFSKFSSIIASFHRSKKLINSKIFIIIFNSKSSPLVMFFFQLVPENQLIYSCFTPIFFFLEFYPSPNPWPPRENLLTIKERTGFDYNEIYCPLRFKTDVSSSGSDKVN